MTSMVATVHLRRAEPPLGAFSPFSRATQFPMKLGIRCLASRPSLYEILGVSPSATQAEIKKAYLTEAKKCHPDLNPSEDAKDRFQKLAEAYEVLGNLERRASYDYSLRSGPSYSGARRAGTGTSPPGGSQHMDPSEVFRSVFEELGVDEVLERLRQVQQEGVVAANAAQAGNFTPAKTFVWKHKGVAAAVLLPLAILFRFPQIISISFRVLGLVAASLLQSPALREMMSRWVWLQWGCPTPRVTIEFLLVLQTCLFPLSNNQHTLSPIIMEVEHRGLEDDFSFQGAIFHFHDYGRKGIFCNFVYST